MCYGLTASGHVVQQLLELRVKMPLLFVFQSEVEGLEHRQPQSSNHLHSQALQLVITERQRSDKNKQTLCLHKVTNYGLVKPSPLIFIVWNSREMDTSTKKH